MEKIYHKLREDQRLTKEEGLRLWQDAPWLEVAQLAWEKRCKMVGDKRASYTLFRIVNYTNVCKISCNFCSFKREELEKGAYVLSEEEILKKTEEALEMGADQIFLQGGVHPNLPLSYYTGILKALKSVHGVHVRGFSPVEIMCLAEMSRMSVPELIGTLKEAGLDSVPGAGAEILSERVRSHLSPKKCTTREWAEIMSECHRQGLNGSANIVVGSIETDEEIIEHLDLVRSIQDQTGGFNSFIPWTFQPQTTDFEVKKVMHHQYLKLLGLCRLYLDNISNLEVSVLVLGRDIGKIALRMGANDISSPVIEENVLRSFGVRSEAESRKLIEEAGFRPFRRDFNFMEVSENGKTA